MAAKTINGSLAVDQNLGTVAITPQIGAIQIDVVMRMNRDDFLSGKSPIECQNLEDRYVMGAAEDSDQTLQQALGYQPTNFIDFADILMVE
jgi:hypothetical protein